MVSSSTRNYLARTRAREARLARMVAGNARDERTEALVAEAAEAWSRVQVSRAELVDAEVAAGRALVRLTDDRVLLGDVVTRTGIGVVDTRRLLRLARPGKAEPETVAVTEGQ